MVEKKAWAVNGYLALIFMLALLIGGIALLTQKNLLGIPLLIIAIPYFGHEMNLIIAQFL